MEEMTCFGGDTVKTKEVATSAAKEEAIRELTGGRAAFGIDLGTTNSAIACIPAGTAPIIVPLKNNKATMPSCIMWNGIPGEFVVGSEAYDNRYKPNCVYSVKRLMEDTDATVTLEYQGEELVMTPAEVSAEILKGLVKETAGYFGDCKDVVVTVPAYFNVNGKKATQEACELAGLNLLGILTEPTAASMCYELTPEDGTVKDILVYDLGGGTFDVSLVRVSGKASTSAVDDIYGFMDDSTGDEQEKKITVIDSGGNTRLGGDDIDRELYNIVLNKIEAAGYDIGSISEQDQESLILKLEKLKKDSVTNAFYITCVFNDGMENEAEVKINVTPDDFIASLLPTYNKTKRIIEEVLRSNRTVADTIVLVGGSTKNPHLVNLLRGDYPSYFINNAFPPDESVALGAGIQAKTLKFGDGGVSVFDSLAIAIGVLEGNRVKSIIPKNSQFPVTKLRRFTTSVDNQNAILVQIIQGNSVYPEEGAILGELNIDGLPAAPAEVLDIDVRMNINANGILTCSTVINDPRNFERPIVKALELNLSGIKDKTIRKLSKDEKLISKWRTKADTVGGEFGIKLHELVNGYPDSVSKKTIMDFIRENEYVSCKK